MHCVKSVVNFKRKTIREDGVPLSILLDCLVKFSYVVFLLFCCLPSHFCDTTKLCLSAGYNREPSNNDRGAVWA